MTVEFDIEKINRTLQDFYNATGIDMQLLKSDFSAVGKALRASADYCTAVQGTTAGKLACHRSDSQLLKACAATRQAQTHICHAGLVDVAIPLLYGEAIIGYIIFGRMKPNRDLSTLEDHIRSLGIDPDTAAQAYRQIPLFDEDRIRSVSNIATLLVKYILLENMLRPQADSAIEKATAFISNNLERELTVQDISESTNLSKTTLYKTFHDHFHCTVGDYISRKRVERSIALLEQTGLSMEEISQRVGFSSASYYSKTFKKHLGISPLQYRKTHRV